MSVHQPSSRLVSTTMFAGLSALLLLAPAAGSSAQSMPEQDSPQEQDSSDAGAGEPVGLSTLTFNAWGMSTVPEGASDGVEAAAALIEESGADLVFLQEIGGRSAELADLLGFESHDLGGSAGIVSRHPIMETGSVEVAGAQGGWAKAVVEVDGVEVVAYSGHLEYRSYANYMPRGYGGEALGDQWPDQWRTWDRLDEPVTDAETLLEVNASSARPEAAAALLVDIAGEQESGRLVLLGGDFNEASALDWTEEAADLFDRNGAAVPWQTTATLQEGGLMDAYRSTFPDPVTHPGFTFPSDNPYYGPEEISWAPGVDERDRIDYIFYLPDEQMSLDAVRLVGPQTSIVEAARVEEDTEDPIFTPEAGWSSDHKAVQADFEICGQDCRESGEEGEAEEPAAPEESEAPQEAETPGETPGEAPTTAPTEEMPDQDTAETREPASSGEGDRESEETRSAAAEPAEGDAAEEDAARAEGRPSGTETEEDLASTGLSSGLLALGAAALAALIGGTAAVARARRRA